MEKKESAVSVFICGEMKESLLTTKDTKKSAKTAAKSMAIP